MALQCIIMLVIFKCDTWHWYWLIVCIHVLSTGADHGLVHRLPVSDPGLVPGVPRREGGQRDVWNLRRRALVGSGKHFAHPRPLSNALEVMYRVHKSLVMWSEIDIAPGCIGRSFPRERAASLLPLIICFCCTFCECSSALLCHIFSFIIWFMNSGSRCSRDDGERQWSAGVIPLEINPRTSDRLTAEVYTQDVCEDD